MTNAADTKDHIIRFLFEEHAVRGQWIQLTDGLQALQQGHQYPAAVKQQLFEAALATNLMIETIKFEGRLSLQAQSGGDLSLLLVQANHNHQFRGVARYNEQANEQTLANCDDLKQLMPGAQMALTIEPEQGKRYQGIVPMHQSSLAANLEDYFNQSEQLATRIWLFNNQETAVGLMLQAMPATGGSNDGYNDNPSEYISGFEHLSQLAQTLKPEEALSLNAETVLHRLFHQDPLRLYPAKPIEYQCGCSRQKSLASLTLVPRDELNEMLAENGKITMNCEFCQTEYAFDSIDIEQIFANAGHDQQGSDPASH